MPTSCNVCRTSFDGPGELCPTHKEEQKERKRAYDRKRFKGDEYRDFLNGAPWRHTSAMVRNQNPICQVTENGKQCMEFSREVHHILSGREYPHLRLDWRNLVALCQKHHPNTDGDMDRYDYVPTKQQVHGIETEFAHPSRRQPVQHMALPTPAGPPPERIPVWPQHADLPDGFQAIKAEYPGRRYEKQGTYWVLLAA
jgi:5-methylcytosine-specific restriction endonuclease McrA